MPLVLSRLANGISEKKSIVNPTDIDESFIGFAVLLTDANGNQFVGIIEKVAYSPYWDIRNNSGLLILPLETDTINVY